jgi:hypothetical protein
MPYMYSWLLSCPVSTEYPAGKSYPKLHLYHVIQRLALSIVGWIPLQICMFGEMHVVKEWLKPGQTRE